MLTFPVDTHAHSLFVQKLLNRTQEQGIKIQEKKNVFTYLGETLLTALFLK